MSLRAKMLGLASAGAACLLVLTACGGSSGSASSSQEPAASSAPASSSAAASSPAASSSAAGSNSDAPGSTAAGVVPGSGDGLKIGYISLGDSLPFVKIVSDSIKAAADEAGAELVFCDSQLDPAKALDCARTFKTQGVQGILNFQLDEKAAAQICEAGPDVPVVAIDIHQRPCEDAFLGADNQQAGFAAGEGLGNYFKTNFNCEYDAFVKGELPGAGEVTDTRSNAMIEGFESVCGPIPADVLRAVDMGGTTDTARAAMADTLTALGGKKQIAVAALNDDTALGIFAAAKAANRADQIWLAAQGADPTSYNEIRNNPNWIGDSAYFPDRYGQTGIPAIIALINGQDPGPLLTNHVFIDKTTIDDYYPA